MNSALENLSKSDLIHMLAAEQVQVTDLKQRLLKKDQIIGQLQRMLFGQKRERFEGDPNQALLPFEANEQTEREREAVHEEKITYVRKKQSRANHKGRLPLPDHLPVVQIEIHPEGDLSAMTCIGTEVTEELELEPARFYIKRYIRYKYVLKGKYIDGVAIGDLSRQVLC